MVKHISNSTGLLKTVALSLLFAVSMAFSVHGWAKALSVETDRQTVEFGDIVTLKITADFQVTSDQLNLDKLKDQFDVLGTQRSNNIQMVNGNFQSSTSWIIQLLPQQEGELIIPPFELENIKSQPYSITVTPIKVEHQGSALRPFFLESGIDQDKPYIQEQVIYTLRFYHQGRYVDGLIRPPKFDKMLVEELKEQSVYQKKIQGKSYTVYEWIYALYPQSSGQIHIDPPVFNGRIQYAGRLKQVKEFAKAISLNVQAEPANYSQQATNSWLPAKLVSLEEEWSLPTGPEIRVGDTLTQVVTMNVEGQKANQLPNIKLLSQTDFKVYPEKPASGESKSDRGIVSVKQFKRSIIATQAGTLTLPEQVVYWWNTQTNQLDKTVLPAKTFQIEAAMIEQQNLVDCTLPTHDLKATPNDGLKMTEGSVSSIWQWLTALFAVLWLATLGIWYKQKQQTSTSVMTTTEEVETAAEKSQQAWSSLDLMAKLPVNELYPAIKQWLKTEHQITHFSQLNQPELQSLIQQIEASLYHESELDNQTIQSLIEQLKRYHQQQSGESQSKAKDSKLSNLYAR
ncbi:MAG: BatD family protein [Pseudomonadota bacterium]|nr:BatD family protein [Pseudomonadota bacterium]